MFEWNIVNWPIVYVTMSGKLNQEETQNGCVHIEQLIQKAASEDVQLHIVIDTSNLIVDTDVFDLLYVFTGEMLRLTELSKDIVTRIHLQSILSYQNLIELALLMCPVPEWCEMTVSYV